MNISDAGVAVPVTNDGRVNGKAWEPFRACLGSSRSVRNPAAYAGNIRKQPKHVSLKYDQRFKKGLYECNLHGKSHPAIATDSETVRKSLPMLLFQVEG